jgi:Ca2+-binding EF-hand superfamily protein
MDRNGDGVISKQDLGQVFAGSSTPVKQTPLWNQLLDGADLNNDGQIDFGEFCELMSTMNVI